MAVEDILRAADFEMHKRENAVIRAAVNRYYADRVAPAGTPIEVLDAELKKQVDELVATMPAVGWEKRDG